MDRRIKLGIRKKAAVLMVVIIILPVIFVLGVNYSLKQSVSEETRQDAEQMLMGQMINSTVSLNRNASFCMENYLNSIEIGANSAAMEIPYSLGAEYRGSSLVWTSKYLLTQVNHTLVREIMNGSAHNPHYDEMLRIAGKEKVDPALYYLANTPALNYSDPHVNGSAYEAINGLGNTLFDRGSMELYDFLYSVLLLEYRDELDSILPVVDTLYSFRNMPDLLWSYYTDDSSGFSVLIPPETYLSPLFNAEVRPWYVHAKNRDGCPWTGVYVDELTGNPVATYSAPVTDRGQFIGVVGFDLLLTTLTERTKEFYASNTSFAFITCHDGNALAYPDDSMLGKNISVGDSEFNMSIREMSGQRSGAIPSVINGREVTLVYSTIECTGWKFINVVDMQEMREKAAHIADSANREVSLAMVYLALVQASVGMIMFIIAFIVVDMHTRRIERLTRYANEASMGNLKLLEIEPASEDEIGELERSLRRMMNSLKVALRELERGEK